MQLGRCRFELLRQALRGLRGAVPASSIGAHRKRHSRLAPQRIVSVDQLAAGGLSARLSNAAAEPAIECTLPSVRQQESAFTAHAVARRPPSASSLARAILLTVRALSPNELVQFASIKLSRTWIMRSLIWQMWIKYPENSERGESLLC